MAIKLCMFNVLLFIHNPANLLSCGHKHENNANNRLKFQYSPELKIRLTASTILLTRTAAKIIRTYSEITHLD